jgi:uncharacterized protein (TIGR03435 family)
MTSSATELAVALTRLWVRTYTCRLSADACERRRAEVESDLWELQHDPERRGAAIAMQLLWRLLAGIPDDIGWSIDRASDEGTLAHGTIVWAGRFIGAAFFIGALWMLAAEGDRARARDDVLSVVQSSASDRDVDPSPPSHRSSMLSAIANRVVAAVSASAGPSQSASSDDDIHFEVASIRPNPAGRGGPTSTDVTPGGRYTAINMPIDLLIGQAFDVRNVELVGGPEWISKEHFDIVATASGDLMPRDGRQPLDAALRRLLRERFRLQVHTEMREVDAYAMVLARGDGKLGPNLIASTTNCDAVLAARRGGGPGLPPLPPPPGQAPTCGVRTLPTQWTADSVELGYLAGLISGELNRHVLDRTGLRGRFNFKLTWTPDQRIPETVGAGDLAPAADQAGPAFATAIREQLGLRLERTTTPVEVLVIDSIERPAPN